MVDGETLSLKIERSLRAGERVSLDWSRLPEARAGAMLCNGDGPALRSLTRHWSPGKGSVPATTVRTFEALRDLSAGNLDGLRWLRKGWSLAWVTLSDKGARGEREDTAGPLVAELVGQALNVSLSCGYLLPDDQGPLQALLAELALVQRFDLVVTTGGTGVAPRDVAPDATLAVIEKRLPGFERAMTLESLAKTPRAVISRAVAGALGQTLIVNLPGSPKAVRECLGVVLPALEHTLEKLQGDPSDCGAF
ncbi:MAG: molybdenum cofactor biosynthesis protein B [Desulfovibrio sp.]